MACERCGTRSAEVRYSEQLGVLHCAACYQARADRLSESIESNGAGAEELSDAESGGLRFTPWAEVSAATPPEPPWVLDGYSARGAVTMLAGKPKAGKSTLAWAMAEAVDAGAGSFLGRRVDGGPVVCVSEEGAGTLRPKLPKSSRSLVLTRDGAWPKPRWPELISAAVAEAKRIGAVLLVVDALSFWASLGEGQAKDPGAAQAMMDALGEATRAGLAVLVVHHTRKAPGEDGDAVRDSNAIVGAVDALVELERVSGAPPGQRRLVGVGRWVAAIPPVLVIEHHPGEGSWRVIGEAESREQSVELGARERVLQAAPSEPPGATEDELAELVGLDRRKIAAPLRELLKEKVVERGGAGQKGDPFRYRKCSPEMLPQGGGATGMQMLPLPEGGEHASGESPRPLRGSKGRNGGDASLIEETWEYRR